jgi:hypothetical protein
MAQKPFGKVRPPLPGSQAGAADAGALANADSASTRAVPVNFIMSFSLGRKLQAKKYISRRRAIIARTGRNCEDGIENRKAAE